MCEVSFYFTYNNNDEYKTKLDILCEVFEYIILEDVDDNKYKNAVKIKLNQIDERKMFYLISYYNSSLRISKIGNELIIGIDKELDKIGLK